MDPVGSSYTDISTARLAEYGFSRQRTDASADATTKSAAGTDYSHTASGNSKSDVQQGVRSDSSRGGEYASYGPDGRLTGESNASDQTDKTAKTGAAPSGSGSAENPQVQQEIARLKATDAKVKSHEAAHKAAGGAITGPVSYTYTRGPDGKTYVTGGEVPISVTPGKTPEETISRMQQVIRAALAPSDPSAQDRAVAAQASTQVQKAQQEKARSATSSGAASPGADNGALQETTPEVTNSVKTGAADSTAPKSSATPSSGQDTAPAVTGSSNGNTINAVIINMSRRAYGNPAVTGQAETAYASLTGEHASRSSTPAATLAFNTVFPTTGQVSFRA